MVQKSRIEDYLEYNPTTGVISWKKAVGKSSVGKEAGSIQPSGYRTLGLFTRVLKAHRVAWRLYYGHWPEKHIDHINRDRSDNRIENLRLVEPRQNTQNSKVFNKGTGRHGNKWRARIRINGRQIHLGHFDSEEKAQEAYQKAVDNLKDG